RGSLSVRLFSQFRYVPDLDRSIAASRHQEPPIGAERQAGHEAGVAAEAADQLSGVAVPDFHGAVLTRRGDPPASLIGAERQGVDLAVMSPEGLKKLARGVVLQVPDLDRILLAPGCQPQAVRAEGHVETRSSGDPRAEQARFLVLLQALRVPEFHFAVAARRS